MSKQHIHQHHKEQQPSGGRTLFEKIWNRHVVSSIPDGPDVLYIDKHFIHEVTSPQAFAGLEKRGLPVFRPKQIVVTADHNVPTINQHLRIGTSEVEMVFATQCLLQSKPKLMRINIDGELNKGVVSKDIILYIISKISASGATGYFVEFAGSAIRSLSMEARMTICNMSIEMGARGGMIAPDQATFDYIKGRQFAPTGERWEKKLAQWKELYSDNDAKFDKEININAADIEPMITYGTNPGLGIAINGLIPTLESIPEEGERKNIIKALDYMGLQAGKSLKGMAVQNVFIGSCTNSRIEDLRLVASVVKGRKKNEHVKVMIVPGSQQVAAQAKAEGLNKIFEEAGFEVRQAGCSACLGMNEDKIPAGEYCISTSNRNFEGRQGAGARTLLASPLTAAAAAITGVVTDIRELLNQ